MKQMENGKISDTMLGREDHGILTCYLGIDFDSTHQSFGGYGFDEYVSDREGAHVRLGNAFGMEFIRCVLYTLEVDRWEKLVGLNIRVRRSGTSYNSGITAIGHIIKDRWFDPEADLAHLVEEKIDA